MTSGNGTGPGLSNHQLRAEVRAVLRDVLPAITGELGTPAAAGDTAEVALRTNADLDAFVRRVADLCADPAQRKALQEGLRRFRLVTPAQGQPSPAAESRASTVRVDRGAVTERLVKKAAADGVRVVLGARAVLTPLARDKARSLGVTIEKEH